MLRKPKKKKRKKETRKTKEKSPQFVKFREELTLLRFEPNFCQLVILNFFSQIRCKKVWDTLTALNFINSAKSSVIRRLSQLKPPTQFRVKNNFA